MERINKTNRCIIVTMWCTLKKKIPPTSLHNYRVMLLQSCSHHCTIIALCYYSLVHIIAQLSRYVTTFMFTSLHTYRVMLLDSPVIFKINIKDVSWRRCNVTYRKTDVCRISFWVTDRVCWNQRTINACRSRATKYYTCSRFNLAGNLF